MRDQQPDTGEARVVKRENERRTPLRDRGKEKIMASRERREFDKSRGNVLGERPRCFYCALMW